MAKPDGAETCGSCHGEGYLKPKVQTFDSLKEHNMYISRKKDRSRTEILLGVFMLPITVVVGGLVLAQLWNWFVPTVFESMPHLTTGQGVGLHTLIGFAKVGLATRDWNEKDGVEHPLAVKLFAISFVYVLMLLGGGFIHLIIS